MLSTLLRRTAWTFCVFAAAGFSCLQAQDTPARSLVTDAVDPSHQVELQGSWNPRAKAGTDRGPVDTSLPTGRLMLMLNRSAERSSALDSFLIDVQTTGSANFHHWLTPEEFGHRFGPSASDVAAVKTWLQSQGLHVESVSRSLQFVEFSGTVAQLNMAFSTHLDRIEIDGVVRATNATPLHFPAALQKSIAGISPIASISGSSPVKAARSVQFHADALHPQWTQSGTTTPVYALAPADLATQYDITPLYTAGLNGAGKTIGIIGESNINTAIVDSFRSTFGLTKNPVQVIVDGTDPGILDNPFAEYHDLNDDPTVSYLGVETAGGLAPGAQIRLYVSAGSEYQDPVLLAAQRAVDDDQADVLSLGYSECESFLNETNGNALYAALWQQAAAQGQTVVVASGYLGSAACASWVYGPAANGMGSTPWNLSVGGTDFAYSDYATGAPSASSLWNTTNDPSTKASLKAPLPEQPWNDSLGQNASTFYAPYPYAWASGGAPSSCASSASTFGDCLAGWPKPAWQSGTGVPQDGVRDTPDVSLFAGDGANFSAYAICEFVQDCSPDSNGNVSSELVGGTSAAAPAMSAIMALVVQKYGRQGQAAPTFYALAQTAPTVFHDITIGGNNLVCILGNANCITGPNGVAMTPGFLATKGYDLATGLGSIDAAQLVAHWADVTAKSSTTTLQLSSQKIQHGQAVTASVNVAGSDGGTPTGAVALVSTSTLSAQQGLGSIALQSGAGSQSFSTLPGGTYQIIGRYGGDGTYGSSSSAPASITVTQESSAINFQAVLTGHYLGFAPFAPNTVAGYGEPIQFVVHPLGASGDGGATGSATFKVNSSTYSAALNAGGYASWTPQALPVGTYTASATYSGDASFTASSSSSLPFSIAPGIPDMAIDTNALWGTIHQGDTVTVGVTIGTQQLQAPGTLAPTGLAEVTLGDCNLYSSVVYYQQTQPLITPAGASSTVSSATFQIPNVAAGDYCLRVIYGGDSNWLAHTEEVINEIIVPATSGIPTTTALQVSQTSIIGGQTATMTATVSAPAGSTVAPTGSVTFYDNGADGNGTYSFNIPVTPGTGGKSVATLIGQNASRFFNSGVNHITAVYFGDALYSSSTSSTVDITATQPGGDFTFQASQNQITLAGGKSGTIALNLTSLLGFNGTVSLACTPSTTKATCSINPSSITLNNSATATLSFNAFTPLADSHFVPGGTMVLFAGSILLFGFRRRYAPRLMLSGAVLLFSLGLGGCGSGKVPTPESPASPANNKTPAGSYTLAVTATSGNITHQVTILVNVQ